MGRLDRWKGVRAAYQRGMQSVEQWARIVAVSPALAGALSIDLEIHWNGQPPFVVNSLVLFPPRGITPQVGQIVAYHSSIGDDHTHYEIDWDQAPRFGPPASAPRDGLLDQLKAAEPPATSDDQPNVARLRMAQNMLDKGLISPDDFERAKKALGEPPRD